MSDIAQLLIHVFMKLGEFVSDQFAGAYPVCPDPLAQEYEMLKTQMSQAKTVQEWNMLRKLARVSFHPELINRLDASGFIVSLNLKNENDD